MSIIESIYNYLKTCSFLKLSISEDCTVINVDYSKNDEVETYSINEVPCKPVIKTYVTGDTENQFLFVVGSVENYGSDVDQNISNLAFYEDFSKWIRTNNKNGILPIMDENQNPTYIECTMQPYMLDNSADGRFARYVVHVRLVYDQLN